MPPKETREETMFRENQVRERVDDAGRKWIEKYVGSGAHFVNWLEQYKEVYGEKNVKIEEIESRGFRCFEEGKERMYRIWVIEGK